MITLRPAVRSDCPGIVAIYNEAVVNSTASYDYEPQRLAQREAWFTDHQRGGYPMFVAVDEAGRIVGWSALSRYHGRVGFRFTVENAVYVAADQRGRGIGRLLLERLLESAKERGYHAVIAAIDGENQASLELHRKFGFEVVGRFRRVGYKFNRWLDVIYMELLLPEPNTSR